MSKASKQPIINFMVKELQTGTERGKVLVKCGKKWGFSSTSFDRYWKKAKEQLTILQQKASKAADDAYIAAQADAAKKAVLSKQERLEILTQIARGTIDAEYKRPAYNVAEKKFQIVTVQQKPSIADRIKAVSEITKMQEGYSPLKVAHTDTDGNNVPPPDQVFVYAGKEIIF